MLDAAASRNLLVNPGFEVHQRGGTITADLAYAHDRWQLDLGGTSTCTITDETTTVDSGSGHALKAVYVHGSAVSYIDQKLEGYLQLRGTTLTFVVRVRKGVSSSVRPYIQATGSRTYGATSVTTGAYETLSVSLAIPAGATSVTVGVELSISDTVYLDNATLHVGSGVVAYVPLSPGEDLARCQRYYYERGGLDAFEQAGLFGHCNAATTADMQLTHPVPMAVAPTATISAAADWSVTNAASTLIACSALTFSRLTTRSARAAITVAAGLVAGNGTIMMASNTTAARIKMEANP